VSRTNIRPIKDTYELVRDHMTNLLAQLIVTTKRTLFDGMFPICYQ